MKQYFSWLLIACMLCSVPALAQDINLQGQVLDDSGEPVIGANVVVEGRNLGTITDLDGRFTLQTQVGDVLKVSYIGYITQKVSVGKKTRISIRLSEDAESLDEVVVVGYATQKKATVAAAISSINSKDLSRTATTTVAGALVGKVSGLTYRQNSGTPGSATTIQIRNMGEPLFVIDGVMSNSEAFNSLDVNDIANISVLKDGPAAIYGVKASNGVILVTSKTGRKKEKATVNINANMGWQQWTEYPDLLNARQWKYANYMREVNSGNLVGGEAISNAKAELEKWQAGYYNAETGEDYRGFNWKDEFVSNAAPQYYVNANISGGSEKSSYYLSASHVSQDAVFKDYNYNRTNLQANYNVDVTDQFKVGFSVLGKIAQNINPALPGGDDYAEMRSSIYNLIPTMRPYANDNPNYLNHITPTHDGARNMAAYTIDNAGKFQKDVRTIQTNLTLEYKTPLKGLSAKALLSYFYYTLNEETKEKEWDEYTYNPITKEYNKTGGKTGSYLGKNRYYREEMTGQFLLNYDHLFAGDHHVTGVAGFEFYKENKKGTNIWQSPIDNPLANLITTSESNAVSELARKISTASFIFRAGYSYKEKYIVDFAGRYDASWRFPTGQQWGFFPSISGTWRISEENFFKNSLLSNWFNSLKIRGSYGEMGDDMAVNYNGNYPDFAFLPGYTLGRGGSIISSTPFGGDDKLISGAASNGIPQTNLSWMKSSILNIGIDLGFLQNRLGVEFDLFRRKRDGIPATPSDIMFPKESGMSVQKQNLDSDQISGFDATVRWTDKVNAFNYYASVNLTLAREKFGTIHGEKFFNAWDKYRWGKSGRWANVQHGEVWMFETIGVFQTQEEIDNYPVDIDGANNKNLVPGDLIFKDINGDGVINEFDERPLGYAKVGETRQPMMTMGMSFGFDWKGIDFAADFAAGFMNTYVPDWHVKNGVTSDQTGYVYNSLNTWHHEDIFDPTSPWVAGEFPALRNNNPSSRWWNDFYTRKINYLRLRNLVVGYTLPVSWTKKARIQKFRLYFEGTNLFCWDSIQDYGFDPEIAGRNGFDYPQHRTYLVGVNITY